MRHTDRERVLEMTVWPETAMAKQGSAIPPRKKVRTRRPVLHGQKGKQLAAQHPELTARFRPAAWRNGKVHIIQQATNPTAISDW